MAKLPARRFSVSRLCVFFISFLWSGWASSMPINDTIVVGDREWAQPGLFPSVSWNDIDAVCSGGPCQYGSTLSGYWFDTLDMTGWTWASVGDVYAMFEHYIGVDSLSDEFGVVYREPDPAWVSLFLADGWRYSGGQENIGSNYLWGWTRDNAPGSRGTRAQLYTAFGTGRDSYINSISSFPTFRTNALGGWFYREATIPVPGTLFLLMLGCTALVWRRHGNSGAVQR